MAMKIENYEGTADRFTWPYNPLVFDDTSDMNIDVKPIPYSKTHIIHTKAGMDPKSIVLNGHLSGTSKRTNFNTLVKHVNEAKLKKLYFGSDRFYICVGKQIKQTNSGGRTNFIDYVASFVSPIGQVFGDTQRSDTYNGAAWSDGTKTNEGPVETLIEKVVVTFDTTHGAGKTLIINDNSDNGITITLDAYVSTDVLTIYLVKLVELGSGIKSTKYWYCEQEGSEVSKATTSGKNSMFVVLAADERIDTFSIGGTCSYSSLVIYWRDGYMG